MLNKFFTKRKMLSIAERKKNATLACDIHVYGKVRFEHDAGSKIYLNEGGLHIGCTWSSSPVFPTLLQLGKNASVHVNGIFRFYEGSMIYVNANANLVLGSGYINNRLNLSCFKEIRIGNNVAISEGVTIRDSDNHQLEREGFTVAAPVIIGDHVWIGLNVTILKGVTIGNGAVIAAGSVVVNDVPERCLVAGVPARVIRENVSWK